MTNTDTADIEATVRSRWPQLRRAGSELVRITVDRDESGDRRAAISATGCAGCGVDRAAGRRLPL